MKEEVRQEILHDLGEAKGILERHDPAEYEELKNLSEHAIEGVAAHKDLDLITVTVLLYSFYKMASTLSQPDCQKFCKELGTAINSLKSNNLGLYNAKIKTLYRLVTASHGKVKEHLQDVMHAARIKKGTALLERGLSIGQAAGLMGLSNWDLQEYAGKTMSLHHHEEGVEVKKRLKQTMLIFQVLNG